MNKALIALALGGLAIGMTEFTMMGILPDIAKDLQIDIPTASNLIALYALGVVVGAPTLVAFTSSHSPRKVLLFLMLLFFVFNGIFAIAPNKLLLLTSRFVAGLPHGAFFGVGSVVAARLAKPGKEAQAISIMFTGMTIANLAGVPLGTYVGHHYSWRITYAVISLLGLVTFLALYFWMPKLEANKSNNILKQIGYFARWDAWLMVAVIAIGTGGLFAWISYIAPLVTEVSGIPADRVPLIMILIGLGMFFGNIMGGKLADTISPSKAAIASFTAMAVCLCVVFFTAHITYLAYPMAFITGMISFSIGSPLQMMLINNAKGAETFAASAGQASFNIGNTLGAYLGAVPITMGYAYNYPSLVGIVMASMGAVLAYIFLAKVVRPQMNL
ncbi:DHA1 family arabinose polymer transporter-like MFS transporter [Sphingobacterium allocomposti]|uniref:DHA1 family arabinose polymer transporter-like MFS transporter n=1 Tax=Sphingobacterium allocomposti TaxID=415956 RepID=A0A5S5DLQ1_9SPHI|nr:MFS transporter [Sphingobacterium composti Yoo et al. 2007 non Ten et al. 2007]TYP96860.1 DHA1 family arabinose polymer transporter-like MFS transporter [Sphingobacterium composti Yoo et al. 2007 non Ten et al. 2007]HLS95642.1 MFS transporter [Sphingobacterium sp.]